MARRSGATCSLLLAVAVLLLSSAAVVQAQDNDLFATFYDSVVDMVVPSYDPSSTAPKQVILFEMPGVGINRQEWDPAVWAANSFRDRQPDAVAASFVDRLPLYYGPTFVDSGSKISTFWNTFLRQYVIPTVQDPEQVRKADAAKAALANGTLADRFQTRLDEYEAAVVQYDSKREDCLSKSPASVCSVRMVSWNERLRRRWFTLEVARRDVSSAEALVLALQVLDLKNIFADALERLGSSQRIDVGAAGFGQEFFITYLTPSNFWRWWPQNVGVYDYAVKGTDVLTFNYTRAGATVAFLPQQGQSTYDNTTGVVTYVPNGIYTGVDRIGFRYTTATGSAVEYKSISVQGSDVLLADTAFSTVSCSKSSSSTSSVRSSSYSRTFESSTTTTTSFQWSWWRVSGGTSTTNQQQSTSSFTSSSSFSSSSSESSMTFDLARVTINRPWLDTGILLYKPVAVRGILKGSWSDGSSSPAKNADQRFKLLPVAFLVARNIVIKNSNWGSKANSVIDLSSSSKSSNTISSQASIGPFFIGASRTNGESSSRDYKETSSFKADSSTTNNAGALTIQGPQVIGWVCTALPYFPNASEEEVAQFEDAQLRKFYKQLAANTGTKLDTLVPGLALSPQQAPAS